MNLPSIKNLDLKKKRIFLRADLNVPIILSQDYGSQVINQKISQDFKLQEILPTIKYIQENNAKIILATHIGRPKAESQTNFFDKDLSTKILLPWFENAGYKIRLERDLLKAKLLSYEDFSEILILENLRFFNGEQGTTQERLTFAKHLCSFAQIYINDSFATIHRDDTSVVLLPELFESKNKAFGMLVEKECEKLNKLKNNPKKPFILVLGGCKIKDKINLLQNFLNFSSENKPSSILIGGAIAYTFLKAQGYQTGLSLVEDEFLDFAKSFLTEAKHKNIKILLPTDHLVVEKIDSQNGTYYTTKNIPENQACVDIGPQTIKLYIEEIQQAKTIFTNGTMGIYTNSSFAKGSREILQAIANNSSAYTVAGGGNCIDAVYKFNIQEKFKFLSTGGGATLAFLAAQTPEELPAFKSVIF